MAEKITKQALIVGAAPCADLAFLGEYLGEKDWTVICADGGVNAALAAGLKPDYLIGDWDSGGRPAGDVPCATLPVEKDFTDLQAAAHWALKRGCRELLLCGCTGGRLDHTASNLVLLELTRKGSNKGGMVAYLANYLGIDPKKIYCVGDNQNDIPMLALSAVPFAPANCAPEVKEWGARILCPCDQGVMGDILPILPLTSEKGWMYSNS